MIHPGDLDPRIGKPDPEPRIEQTIDHPDIERQVVPNQGAAPDKIQQFSQGAAWLEPLGDIPIPQPVNRNRLGRNGPSGAKGQAQSLTHQDLIPTDLDRGDTEDLARLGVEAGGLRVETEIVTRDKVSLRVNLTADYRVANPVQARTHLSDPVAWLYRRLQLALRQAIGERTLDALLADKEHLNQVVFQAVAAPAAAHGLELTEAGAKDFILPGEMKDILNQVVMADKEAQANVIRRREETAATRSLLNTAKLMDENPTLLRLKELEILEQVAEKIDRLTVYGGLEGILKDTVRVNVPMDTAH